MDLSEIRIEIDAIDKELTALLVKRMKLSKEVAAYKKANGLPIFVPEREQAVLEKVAALSGEEMSPYIRNIYQFIMDESKKLQEDIM